MTWTLRVVRIGDVASVARLAVLTVHDVTGARRLERLKADFIATVSHELRTPITPIKGYAQLLAARGPQMDPARWRQGLRTIEDPPTISPDWWTTSCWRPESALMRRSCRSPWRTWTSACWPTGPWVPFRACTGG